MIQNQRQMRNLLRIRLGLGDAASEEDKQLLVDLFQQGALIEADFDEE